MADAPVKYCHMVGGVQLKEMFALARTALSAHLHLGYVLLNTIRYHIQLKARAPK